MSYLTDAELDDLPEEKTEAFVKLEQVARARLKEELENTSNNSNFYTHRYMNTVISAAKALSIDEFAALSLPKVGSHEFHEFQDFTAHVDHFTMQFRLLRSRRTNEYSVALDGVTKVKLRHLLQQVRETVDKLDITTSKRDRLYSRVAALELEIDRERTRYEALAAIMIETADDGGEAASRLEPVMKLIERFGAAIGLAKRQEVEQKQLPKPDKPKQIEGPKQTKINDQDL